MRRTRRLNIGLAAATVVALMAMSGTLASFALGAFTGSANASQAISTRTLSAPSTLTATPSGHDVALNWTAGTNGNRYSVLGAANGTSSNCSAATYAALTAPAGTTYNDTGRYQPQGTYYCYQVKTTYNTWSSITGNPTAAAQLGFVAQSVQVTNGGAVGKLDTGDKIVITYNQSVTTSTSLVTGNLVCTNAASTGNIIMIGDAIAGCNATTPVTVGTVSSGASNRTAAYNITWAWTNNNTILTITIGTRASGSLDPTISGTLTFTPTTTATKTLSATGAYHNCDTNTGGANCTPTITGGF